MPNFIEHLGLEFLTETEEKVRDLWTFIAQNGKAITGYYGYPYLNYHFGDAQFILQTIRNDEEKRLEVVGMDTHAAGSCAWEVSLSGINVARNDATVVERRCVVHRASDGGGMAVVNIVNADVLPCFDEGEIVRLQMVAFPTLIEYFKDEAEYVAAQPETSTGHKWLLADGSMLASGLMRNHDPESDEFQTNDDLDDLMLIRGTVKKLAHGVVECDGNKDNAFIYCLIGTENGDLEIIHTADAVKEEQLENVRVGAIVNGAFVLSGDAAIYEYENGAVFNEENDLSILRSTFAGADPERMRSVFAENATYLAEYNNTTYTGRDEIINRLKSVAEDAEKKYFAHFATITSVLEGEEELRYGVGKRCIVIAYGEEDNYQTIAFADIDEDGRISRLVTSVNERYRFQVDAKPMPQSPLDDIIFPENVVEPIISRARFHGLIDEEVESDNVLNEIGDMDMLMYENNANLMLEEMPETDEETTLKNLFGYLFAKAIETAYSNKQYEENPRGQMLASYSPEDAWRGEIHTLLTAEENEKISNAMELGKQFAKDFAFFHPFGEAHDNDYDADLRTALIVVQQLGHLYAPKCMK